MKLPSGQPANASLMLIKFLQASPWINSDQAGNSEDLPKPKKYKEKQIP